MKKQRWLSLVLILALVVGLCSVCAAAADDQTAEQPAQEAADTVAEAEAAPADGRQKQTRKLPNSRSRMRRQKRMRPQRKRRRTARISTRSTARTPVRNRLSSR